MIIILQNTDKIVDVNGIQSRLWQGKTDSGIQVTCLIIRIAVNMEADQTEFDRELIECRAPSPDADQAFPARKAE
jgi:hypothetical protein